METKHTKGIWKVDKRAGIRVECNGITVASCSNSQSGDNYEECYANAKLISYAPELLEALNNTLEIMYKCECPKELQEEYANAYMNYSELIKTATE